MGKVIDYKEKLYELEEMPYGELTPKQRNTYEKLSEWEENEDCQCGTMLFSDEEYTKKFKDMMNSLAFPINYDKEDK